MTLSIFASLSLFAEIDLYRSLGAALVGAAVIGTVAAGRWFKARHAGADTSGGAVASSGGYYATIAVVMAIGLACAFGGIALMTMNR